MFFLNSLILSVLFFLVTVISRKLICLSVFGSSVNFNLLDSCSNHLLSWWFHLLISWLSNHLHTFRKLLCHISFLQSVALLIASSFIHSINNIWIMTCTSIFDQFSQLLDIESSDIQEAFENLWTPLEIVNYNSGPNYRPVCSFFKFSVSIGTCQMSNLSPDGKFNLKGQMRAKIRPLGGYAPSERR